MKAVLQRVTSASVTIEGKEQRSIGRGLAVLLAVGADDTDRDTRWIAGKIADLRVFPDEKGRFDRSLLDIKGEVLLESQFTLYGDSRKGKRPDFTAAARPEKAIPEYERCIAFLKEYGLTVRTGEFGADMLVDIRNDGPVTIILDSRSAG
jgi:D-tyrosyl-tRNA(Tyr) deacylase